ncbi:aldo/keto reductase [Vibrio sp. CAU 1672]|uniref:aldo/keto reductase n=1 Tax=Vibrio sp. CAU 1672 TaxID=3032594 RepID=UPI0023DC9B03|nr:aldo/keto reductase [Vibrio sp. CAU 1672]MDF2156141.1 aldo/keto reductase [Vibrio sp. CAU 1672]
MQTHRLGHSELDISVLGLGTWAIGGDIGQWGWGKQSEQDSIAVLHHAIDCGINWVDTAPAYGLGNAERIVGKALKGMSQKPYIFTKCGFRWYEKSGELYGNLCKASIIDEVEQSLRRLQVECIDLYQIHQPIEEERLEEAWLAMQDLQSAGKVRYLGGSNFSVEQLSQIKAHGGLVSTQPSYSLINREIEQSVLPWCQHHNIGTIHHSTMANGLLSGRWSQERKANLTPRDWRHKSGNFTEPHFSRNLMLVEFLAEMATGKGCTVSQLSVAWTLAHPATTGSIIGARNIAQLNELLPAADVQFTPQELDAINEYQSAVLV